jgi:hypothetical protein
VFTQRLPDCVLSAELVRLVSEIERLDEAIEPA